MQRAIIILLIIVFGLSTVGMYIAAAGTPAQSPGGQSGSEVKSEQRSRQNADLPAYLQTGDSTIKGTRDATGESKVAVEVNDTYFTPTVLRVTQGTEVVWRNHGSARHSVTSERSSPRKGLNSGMLAKGNTYRHTFDKPGVYNYYSESDPTSMKAVVQVVR